MNKSANELSINDKIYVHQLEAIAPGKNSEKGILDRKETVLQVLPCNRMIWTQISFGKHKDKTLPQVMFNNADWFFWAYENRCFKNGLAHQAREIYRRSRCIRVPEIDNQERVVKYEIYKSKFQTMCLIPNIPGMQGENVSRLIDFYTPKKYAQYDKTGFNNFVHALKGILFGNPGRYMTKAICEEFFSNDSNFDLFYAAKFLDA